MQRLRILNCTIWSEGVKEIVSAEKSTVKFIISDHPVTAYNPACLPDSEYCRNPCDPHISLKGTQTIFPLGHDHCLILTNLEYARDPDSENPLEQRTNPRHFAPSLARTDAFIRCRSLMDHEVEQINLIIKSRAQRYVAAREREWLSPEKRVGTSWPNLNRVLRPPKEELHLFGGEIFIGFQDGSVSFQDAFGRTTSDHSHLKKKPPAGKIEPDEPCPCGSGRMYKKCCRDIPAYQRPSFTELSIRERNLIFVSEISRILGLSKGKTWRDVRKNLSDEQVKEIHEIYGVLWPVDANIYSLLPAPNEKISRAICSGTIDPIIIARCAINMTLYFDETILVNPFTNPGIFKPAFNPIGSPHRFKQKTLENVWLILQLTPFIKNGYINLIPNPSIFNIHLRKEVMGLAQKHRSNKIYDESYFADLRTAQASSMMRIIFSMPVSQQRTMIQQTYPSMPKDKLNEFIQRMEKEHLSDPLTLLQDDIYAEGGQLAFMDPASFNLELGLLIAQITGAVIVTDSQQQWKEIERALSDSGVAESKSWSKLLRTVENIDFLMSSNSSLVLELRQTGKSDGIRRAFREMKAVIEGESNHDASHAAARLCTQMQREHKAFLHQWETLRNTHTKEHDDSTKSELRIKLTYRAPHGGLTTNNVRHLLIISGSIKHKPSIGLAIYANSNFSEN